jgi:hypothetical protein
MNETSSPVRITWRRRPEYFGKGTILMLKILERKSF